ncbi:MAG: hypothetical protein JWO97_3442, partial [Acidobacteria bacterium]|nr:hypothetical protein [Acidobacteriota bacterium]
MATNRRQYPSLATVSVRLLIGLIIGCALFAPIANADPFPPYYGNGTASPAGPIHFVPVAWPTEPQWIAYTRNDAPIKDPRVQDPSNGGTSPQNYVNVSSGCPDQTLPSVYYYYNPVTRVIFYRWRVEQRANNFATGPSAGSASSSNPWNSALWTVMLDLDGDGYRDFAIHLNGSSGSPSTQIDVLNAIWSPTKTNSIDYLGDPTNIHLISHNPTAFIQGTSGNSNGSILQFDGNGNVSTTQWPNGSSETVWDYGTTRSIDLSTSSCEEYFVDYQIPLDMLDATAYGGPKLGVNTPFSFVFATANSLNNPFQKDVVLDGAYVCPPTSPAPFGDPLTLAGGIIKQPIVRAITTGNVSGSCTIPVTAAILDALNITNCQTISTLTTAKFFYYYDSNGDGLDNDGGTWTFFSNGTPTGTTVTGSLDVSTLLRGHYLIAIELTDGALPAHNVMQSWLYTATPFSPIFGSTYGNVPTAGISAPTKGVNFTTIDVALPCGGASPTVSKTVSVVAGNVDGSAQAGGTVTYTLNVKNNSATAITISSITDSLPPGFTWTGNVAGTLTATPPAPAGTIGTITWTLSPAVTIAGNDATTYTFKFNATAPTQQGTYYNSGSFITNVGTFITGQAPVIVRTATMSVSKSNFDATTTSSSVANRGDNITYTINYANTSGIPTSSVVITDVLPAGFTYNGGSASVAPASVNTVSGITTLTWNIGAVSANTTPAPITFTAVATIGGLQTNNVTLTSTEAPTVTGSASIFVNGPVLSITKTPSQTRVVPAGGLTYTVVVQNTGNAAATLTALTDAYPNVAPTLTYASSSPAGCTAATAAGVTTVTCTAANGGLPASLVAGATLSYTFTFSASSGSGTITDTATINSSNAAAATAQATITVAANATCVQASQTKYYFRNISPAFTVPAVGATSMNRNALTTAGTTNTLSPLFTTGSNVEIARFYQDPLDATNGSLITFDGTNNNIHLFYEKDGGNKIVSTVTVNDFNPATQTFVQIATVTGGGVSGAPLPAVNIAETLAFPAGSYTLPAGHRVLWIVKVTDSNAGNATTGKLQYDGAAASNFDSYGSLCIVPIQAPSVVKFGDKPQATPGVDNVTFTIPYANTAAGTLAGATITDTLPAGMTYVSGTGVTAKVASIAITNGGSGYLTSPTVTIAGCTTAATATAYIDGSGVVTQVNVTNSGATCAAPTVTFSAPPAGVTAIGTASLTGISQAGQIITYTLGTLPANGTAGASGSVSLTASVGSGIASTSATNNVTMTNAFTGSTSATATTTFVRPNVTISKTVSNATPAPGASFSYTITVLNGGNGAASAVVVTDDFPSSALNFVSATSASTTCSYAAPTITCTGFSLASGAAATITVNASVPTSVDAGQTTVTNTAHVIDSFNTTPRNASVNVTITGTPTITLTKTSALDPLVGARLVYVNVTSGGSGYTSAPAITVIGCTGATATAYVSGGVITAVSVTGYGSQCSSPTLSLSGGGGSGATFSLVTGAAPGDTITYTLTAKNLSGTSTTTGVVINDTIPSYTSYGSGADSFSGATGTATFNIGSIAAGTSAVARTYTVIVNTTVPAGVTTLSTTPTATSTNAGSATAAPPTDFTGANPVYTILDSPSGTKPFPEAAISGALPSASTTFTVSSASLMAVGDYIVVQNGGSYSVTQVAAISGTTITVSTPVTATSATIYPAVVYSVPYANTGNVSGTPAVSVALPAGLLYAAIPSGYPSATSAPAVGSSGTITWGTSVIGTLLSGGSGVVQFVAFPTVAGTYTNTATITDGLRNATATATTVFGALNPSKSTTTPSIVNQSPTNVAHYVVTVSNPLATAATVVTITDNLPEGFAYHAGSTSGTSEPAGTSASPVWTVASLAGNSTLTFSFDADISANTPNGVYQNEVLVASTNTRSLIFDYLGTTSEDVTVCNPVPAIIAPDVCGSSANDYAVVPVTPAASYTWSITNGGGTITSAASGTGMVGRVTVGNGGSGYTAGLTNVVFAGGGGGSGATATVTVVGGVITAVTITNPGNGYNSAPTVTFTGSGTGATAASTLGNGIRYTAGASGTVAIQVSMTTGSCSAVIGTKSVIITTITAPSASNGGPYCVGGTIQLSTPAVIGATYSWTGPNSFTSSLQNPTVAATTVNAGTYNVTITANGCTSAPGSTTVVVNALPTATITPSGATIFCAGGSVTLTASGGTSYLWSTGATTAAITVSTSGTYSVTTTSSGCTSAPASQIVTVNPSPTATITPSGATTFCAGGSVTLTASGGTSYLWSTGATTAAITVSTSGTYSVTTTSSGCTSAPASQIVTV